MADRSKPEEYYSVRVLSYEPLITLSSCHLHAVFVGQMAEDLPGIFDQKFGLHILLPTWNVERELAAQMKSSIAAVSNVMPGHRFIVVSNTEYETFLLGLEGVPALFANQSIFVDDNIWRPLEERSNTLGSFDAVMNARIDKEKRHELAADIRSIVLIYEYSLHESIDESTKRLKKILPHAFFANHEINKGQYRPLAIPEILQILDRAHVGLCLTSEEGYSRASIEYLLAGLPVVSTRSIGGRDRYYSGDYCRVVDDNPHAVANAVDQLLKHSFSRTEIRESTLRLLRFDRCNFLRGINRVVENYTGLTAIFDSIEPFRGIKQKFVTHSENLKRLHKDFEARSTIPGRIWTATK